MKKNFFQFGAESSLFQAFLTLVTYAFYAAIIGICLLPSVYAVLNGFAWLASSAQRQFGHYLLFSFIVGGSLYLYFITGVLVMGAFIRLISLGIRPGRYARGSFTMLRWLIYSGIYTIAYRTVLPMIPVTFFSNLFFRLVGCKVGKRVYLNTWMLNDAYLIEIGDDVIIGGQTDISCHMFEHDCLILDKVHIGSGTLIGAHCYISPGVRIGERCTIGLNSYIRRNKRIPDGSTITVVSSLPIRDIARIENRNLLHMPTTARKQRRMR